MRWFRPRLPAPKITHNIFVVRYFYPRPKGLVWNHAWACMASLKVQFASSLIPFNALHWFHSVFDGFHSRRCRDQHTKRCAFLRSWREDWFEHFFTLQSKAKWGFAFAAQRSTSSLVRRRARESSARIRAEYPSLLCCKKGLRFLLFCGIICLLNWNLKSKWKVFKWK